MDISMIMDIYVIVDISIIRDIYINYKDIFIKMMDFIRNYDAGSDEYTRHIRFVGHDSQSNDLARKVLELGEIKIHDPKPTDSSRIDDTPPRSSGLARSKSDHRLVAEFRRREETEKYEIAFKNSFVENDNKNIRYIHILCFLVFIHLHLTF